MVAFPDLRSFVLYAVEVANLFVSALCASPIIVSREVWSGGDFLFALADSAPLAVAVEFGWVMRAHFVLRDWRGRGDGRPWYCFSRRRWWRWGSR